jgi:uncharacterized protein (TIGR02246 family)
MLKYVVVRCYAIVGLLVVMSCSFAAEDMSESELLRYLQDRIAIEDLVARYSVALDSGDAQGYANLFAAHGELTSQGKTYRGHDEILGSLRGALRSPAEEEVALARGEKVRRLRHLISGVKIDITGDRGTVRANWVTVSMAPDNRPGIGGMGYFDDAVVKEDGRWLFATHNLIVELQSGPPPAP